MLINTETDDEMWTDFSDSEQEADMVDKGLPWGTCGTCHGYHKRGRQSIFPDELKNFFPGRKKYFTETCTESDSFLELSQLCENLKKVIQCLKIEFDDHSDHYILHPDEYDTIIYYRLNKSRFFEKDENTIENTDYKFIMDKFIKKIDIVKTKSRSVARDTLCDVLPENIPDLAVDKIFSFLGGMEDFSKL